MAGSTGPTADVIARTRWPRAFKNAPTSGTCDAGPPTAGGHMPDTTRTSRPMARVSLGSRHRPEREDMTKHVLHVMRMRGVAGSERHLLELARALRPLGWTSDAVIPSPAPEALRSYAAELASAGGGRGAGLP